MSAFLTYALAHSYFIVVKIGIPIYTEEQGESGREKESSERQKAALGRRKGATAVVLTVNGFWGLLAWKRISEAS